MKNELHREKSLYLRQHQDNPVNWQTYSKKIIQRAIRENKPLFISVGYSSCHWCHVMAHESFENETSAKILNEYFIPVKIDREEFPGVDKKYQFYLHATGKRGGWPLSAFCLPDGRPFFGGTYFPQESKHGLPAFNEIVTRLGRLFRETPAEAKKYADNYDKFFTKFIAVERGFEDLSNMSKDNMFNIFTQNFDKERGGLGKEAKFPNIPTLSAMLPYLDTDKEVRDFLVKTSDQLCLSGIYDHVNGGFYRYAVDADWRVPHFEKMLYDNAQNAYFLLQMFELTDNMLYYKIAVKTIDFILNEFNTDFGLITAMDADSLNDENVSIEGFYYLVTEKHIEPIKDFVDLHEGVISLKGVDYKKYVEFEKHFEKLKNSNDRAKPNSDGKVILSLNMMFCKTLLKMFEMSGDDFYMEQATALFNKLRHFLIDGDNLFRINYNGEIFGHTTLEDYVQTIDTHMAFFELTKEKTFLAAASAFAQFAVDNFVVDGVVYLNTDKDVVDTFDDSTPNPACMLIKLLEDYSEYFGIPKDHMMLDFAADRLIKYTGGHPTLFNAMKGYLK